MHTLAQRKAEIISKVNSVLDLAKDLYMVDIKPTIRFDLTGRCAGIAGRNSAGQYYLRFNTTMMMDDASYQHILTDTVPHEVAHLVCLKRPQLGTAHNPGWKRVCSALGGNGKRCHSMEVIYAKGDTYACNTTTGHTVMITGAVYNKIQLGAMFSTKVKGKLTPTCVFTLVGREGVRVADTPKSALLQQPVSKPSVMGSWIRTTKAVTKAQAVRAIIGDVKARGWTDSAGMTSAMLRAVSEVGMSRSLATAYVKNNWDKV
jgi:predicted SprT family Zn-dependent metalloprotease